MAKEKKSFLLYCDLIHTFEHLTKDQRSDVIMWILNYVNDNDPELPGGLLNAVIEPIKQQLKRDLKKYEKRAERARENGSKGGRPKNLKKPSGLIQNPTEPKKPDTVTDTVTVIDSNKLDFVKLLSFINLKTGRKFKTINDKVKLKYKARLKDGYTKEDILNSIINASNLQYHKDNGCQYLTPEFFSRQDTLDKYGNEAKGNLIASFPDPVN